VLKMLALSIFT